MIYNGFIIKKNPDCWYENEPKRRYIISKRFLNKMPNGCSNIYLFQHDTTEIGNFFSDCFNTKIHLIFTDNEDIMISMRLASDHIVNSKYKIHGEVYDFNMDEFNDLVKEYTTTIKDKKKYQNFISSFKYTNIYDGYYYLTSPGSLNPKINEYLNFNNIEDISNNIKNTIIENIGDINDEIHKLNNLINSIHQINTNIQNKRDIIMSECDSNIISKYKAILNYIKDKSVTY